MIHAQTIQFLEDLKANNNKPWFDANRKNYETAKQNFGEVIGQLIKGLGKFDNGIEESNLQVKDCIFRINRDVRFSKDKSPYKTNFGAWFNGGGKKAHGAGYYFHIDANECFFAGGVWMPENAELKKIRDEIDYNFEEIKAIIDATPFRKYFPAGLDREAATVRPPKGYDENNPAIELLKLKSFTVSQSFSITKVLNQGFVDEILTGFGAMYPYITFLNRAIKG
jgi:uncharacterized protein (TIGR02453 family)